MKSTEVVAAIIFDEQIAPLFAAARNLPNIALPEGWREQSIRNN